MQQLCFLTLDSHSSTIEERFDRTIAQIHISSISALSCQVTEIWTAAYSVTQFTGRG